MKNQKLQEIKNEIEENEELVKKLTKQANILGNEQIIFISTKELARLRNVLISDNINLVKERELLR